MIPPSSQVWDQHCDRLLDGFVSIMDRNQDGRIGPDDSAIFYDMKPEVKFICISLFSINFFFSHKLMLFV